MICSSSSTKTSGATFAQFAVPMQVDRSIRTVTAPTFRSTNSVTAVTVIVSAADSLAVMGRINMKRVVLGGIVSAVIVLLSEGVFAFLMREEWRAALAGLGLQVRVGPAAYLPIVWSFFVGVISIWLYAAIRPRYGPGAKTALRAALAIWAFSTVTFAVAFGSIGLFPARLVVEMTIWSLAEIIVATLVGAWIYREKDFAAIP